MSVFFGARASAKLTVISPEEAIPGSTIPVLQGEKNFLNHVSLDPLLPSDHGPRNSLWPDHIHSAVFGGGCFWGFEKAFWSLPGVYTTAVGYAGGTTVNPTYSQVCSGLTGHAEVVLVAYDPELVTYADLLVTFWESHDPTQLMRQGADVGTQYRSVLLTANPEQLTHAQESLQVYQQELDQQGYNAISTQITPLIPPSPTDSGFYLAEAAHQQYLAKNPAGYCGHGGTGVSCPIPPRHKESAV